jgi:hypothetical protein
VIVAPDLEHRVEVRGQREREYDQVRRQPVENAGGVFGSYGFQQTAENLYGYILRQQCIE